MDQRRIYVEMLSKHMDAINDTIDCLYSAGNFYRRRRLLNGLRKQTIALERSLRQLKTGADKKTHRDEMVFTAEELARFNGKDGYPAYVAINWTVYDVTNIAAWGGATHFGLTAGKDVTAAFMSCHENHNLLGDLPVVGVVDV